MPTNDLCKRRNICQLIVYVKPSLCSLISPDTKLTNKDSSNNLEELKKRNKLTSVNLNLSNTSNNETSRCNDSNINVEDKSSWFRISQYFVRLI